MHFLWLSRLPWNCAHPNLFTAALCMRPGEQAECAWQEDGQMKQGAATREHLRLQEPRQVGEGRLGPEHTAQDPR